MRPSRQLRRNPESLSEKASCGSRLRQPTLEKDPQHPTLVPCARPIMGASWPPSFPPSSVHAGVKGIRMRSVLTPSRTRVNKGPKVVHPGMRRGSLQGTMPSSRCEGRRTRMRGQRRAGQPRDTGALAPNLSALVGRVPPSRAQRCCGAPLVLAATVGLVLLLAFVAVMLLQGGSARAQTQSTAGIVRLTFDDGPVRPNTRRVLDVLRKRGVKATFFVVGQQARRYPSLVRRAYSEGHSVQNHTYTHADLTTLTNAGIKRELRATNRTIKEAGVPRPYRFRPPYGATSARVRSVGASLGLTQTLWSVDPRDWENPPASVICRRVVNSVRPRSVVLLHDGTGANTVEALPCIIRELRARGYGFRKL